MTWLIRYCEGVMEATWLTALVCVPLFFIRWGESIQDAKSYLLRSLAVVLLAAWSVKLLNQAASRRAASNSNRFNVGQLLRTPLVAPVLLVTLVAILSTLLSLSPWVSFWGTAVRRTGTYTFLSCLTFFAAMAACIRSERQVSRIISAIILTSVPISIYAIEQRSNVGPIISRETGIFRVGSTFGNPVFLAAYLIMVVPLAASRIVLCWHAFRQADHRHRADLVQGGVYGLIVILQLWAVFFTISRGPSVGLVIGALVMFLLWAIYWRRTWMVFAALGVGAFLMGSLVLLSWSNGPFRALANRPEVQRFTSVLNQKGDTSGRNSIWAMAVQASQFPPVVISGDGRKDPLSGLRMLVGYGPDTIGFVSRAFAFREYNIESQGHPSCDRIHNDFWDTLLTTGFLGLAANLALTFLVVYHACRWLGLIPGRHQMAIFWALFLGGGLVGCLGFGSWKSAAYLGVGLRFGTAAGLMAYLVWVSWRRQLDSSSPRLPLGRALTIMALLAGVVAHLIETNFSFGVETTTFYFCVYLALLVVIGHRLPEIESRPAPISPADAEAELAPKLRPATLPKTPAKKSVPARKDGKSPKTGFLGPAWYSHGAEVVGGLALALVWINLGLLLIQKSGMNSAAQAVLAALTRLPGDYSTLTSSLLVAMAATWLAFAVTTAYEAGPITPPRTWIQSVFVVTAVSGVSALVFWIILANCRSRMLPFTSVGLGNLNQFIGEQAFLVHFFYGFMVLLILFTGYCLAGSWRRNPDPRQESTPLLVSLVSVVVAASAGALVYNANIKWSSVEAMDHWAETFQGKGEWPIAAAICEASIKATPAAEHQYFFLGKILTEQAVATKDPKERLALFKKAEQILETGGNLRPIDHAFLARRGFLYFKWAETESDPAAKTSLANKSIEFYRQALVLDPGNNDLWYTLGYVAMAVLRSPDQALPGLIRSADLYPNSHTTYGLLGDAYYYKGVAIQPTDERSRIIRSALTNYLQAAELSGTNDVTASYRYTVALGKSHKELGEPALAVAAFRSALSNAPAAERWGHEETLARLFDETKEKTNAVAHLQRAIELAPPGKQAELLNLKTRILSNP